MLIMQPKNAAFPRTLRVTGSRINMKVESVTSSARKRCLRALHFARVDAAAMKGEVEGGDAGGKRAVKLRERGAWRERGQLEPRVGRETSFGGPR